jgi:hypothetical protein
VFFHDNQLSNKNDSHYIENSWYGNRMKAAYADHHIWCMQHQTMHQLAAVFQRGQHRNASCLQITAVVMTFRWWRSRGTAFALAIAERNDAF